jgi:hypothetical protein
MTRLIDADALIEAMTKFNNATGEDMTHGIFYAHIAPTVDAVPVKRGMWTFIRLTDKDYGHKAKECSSCGSTFFDTKQWNYCPNCGVRMDKDE